MKGVGVFMKKPYVFITRKLPTQIVQALEDVAEVKMWDSEEVQVPREVLLEEAAKADALLTMLSDKVDEQLLSNAPNLKIVANLAVGYDNIDIYTAANNGVVVTNTPDVLTDTTADLAFSLLLATARRIVEGAQYIKEGKWNSWSPFLLAGTDVHHKTIGIVGMGKIGQAVAKRASGFDMEILYHNRSRNTEAETELGAVYQSLEELLKKSDYIVCLTPLTEETKHLFGKEQFKMMKNSAIFINVGRGQVVVEEDLVEALKNGDITGAGLDVFYQEPISNSHPLLELPQVVAIPHIGSASVETRTEMMELCCKNIKDKLTGKEVKSILPN